MSNLRTLLAAIWADPDGRQMAAKGFYHDLYMSQFRGDAKPADL